MRCINLQSTYLFTYGKIYTQTDFEVWAYADLIKWLCRTVFSIFSLKWNSLQQFSLLTEPMGLARNLSRGKSWNSRPKPESAEAVFGKGQQAKGYGECCKLTKRDCRCILDALRAQKTHLVVTGVISFLFQFDSAEPLDAVGITLGSAEPRMKNTDVDCFR